ncbi:MAG TPA: hypothetical protein ENK26_09740 [Gammaproteobacteria bacterium]|nr:hypothetical protein [Gammaproteobacteria bacterium]
MRRFALQFLSPSLLALLLAAPAAHAEKTPRAASHPVHGTAGLSLDSHLVSYGLDVWGAGNDRSSPNAGLLHPWVQATTQTGRLSFHAGSWLDINDNSTDSLTGKIQEFDIWAGYGVNFDRLDVGMTLQRWRYASTQEVVLDTWMTFNDYGLLFKSLALKPGLKLHSQLASAWYSEASALVARIEPGRAIGKRKIRPIWLSTPVEFGFQQNGFKGGRGGHSFTSIGAQLYVPLVMLPKTAGDWSLNLGAVWYATNHDQIPGNRDARFTTARVGLIYYF